MAENTSDASREQAATAAAAPAAVTVRAARADDMPRIHTLIHELAVYEGMPDGPQLSVQDLIRDGFESPSPWFFGLVAEKQGEVVGHALCNRAYSSWTCRAYYIEDLYVVPSMRRAGVGMSLLRHICQMALQENVHRIDWHVLESNAAALSFYARLGARDMRTSEGRAALRLDRARIHLLAHHTPPATATATAS